MVNPLRSLSKILIAFIPARSASAKSKRTNKSLYSVISFVTTLLVFLLTAFNVSPTYAQFTPTLYRALNLNGPATTIDGNSWQSSNGAANFNYTTTGWAFENQSVTLVPSTDANRAAMIRSSIWGNPLNLNVTSVPNGGYDVYLYTWEDNLTTTFSISLEGTLVQAAYNSGSAGTWSKLGPFRACVYRQHENIVSRTSCVIGSSNLYIQCRSITACRRSAKCSCRCVKSQP